MPSIVIPSGASLPFYMDQSDRQYIVVGGTQVTGGSLGIVEESPVSGNALAIHGSVEITGAAALDLYGDGTSVTVGGTARIEGGASAIRLAGAGQSLVNAGQLVSQTNAVEVVADLGLDFDITNTGTVHGGEAAFFLTGEGAFTNNGRIEGASGIYWYDSSSSAATMFSSIRRASSGGLSKATKATMSSPSTRPGPSSSKQPARATTPSRRVSATP